MSDNKTLTPTLELVYVPDTYTETERLEGASWPLGSGHYDLNIVVNGASIRLNRFKAGVIDKQLALAKDKRAAQQQQQQPTEQRPEQQTQQPEQPQQQQ